MDPIKVCSNCKVGQPLSSFGVKLDCANGLRSTCKKCTNILSKNTYIKNKTRILLYHKKYRNLNREKIREQSRKYSKLTQSIQLKRDKIRRIIDPQYKIAGNLRHRLNMALKGKAKKGSAVKDLGCSLQHLKLHLELFWDEGMSWDNYGYGEDKWHIDHIKPISSFDLTDRSQLLKACNYKNLQPLWQKDNFYKHDRVG